MCQCETVEIMSNQTYSDFLEWFKKFNQRWCDTAITPNKQWFENVENSHDLVREKIGGVSIEKIVSVKQQNGPADRDLGMKVIQELENCLTTSIYGTGFVQSLQLSNINKEDLLYPTITIGTHNSMKTSKFLSRLMSKYSRNYDEYQDKISDMGKLWAKSKSKNATYQIELNTTAEAFVKLGHYDVDHDSCFKQNGGNKYDKLLLAQHKDTFIVTIKEKGKYIARGWGFYNNKSSVFNVCNLYLGKGVKEGDVLAALREFFKQLLGCEEINIHESKISVEIDVYQNPWGNFSFTDKKYIAPQALASNCGLCIVRYYDDDDDWDDHVDDWDDDDDDF